MYIIGYTWEEVYDFMKNGERINGTTRKALILTLNNAGAVVRSTVSKVSRDCKPLPVGEMVEFVNYDEFGKIVGVSA